MAASTQLIFTGCIAILCCSILSDAGKIGVNYGMLGDNLPTATQVVTLLKDNNIGKTRIFQASQAALTTFENSGIDVIVGIGNDELQAISSSQGSANSWVNDNIVPFYPSTNITYIAVGNEVLPSTQYASYLVPAMTNIFSALQNANLHDLIKVSTPHSFNVINKSFPPSQGAFGEDLKDTMSSILSFLSDNGAPFMANIYPYFTFIGNTTGLFLEYALFESTSQVVKDTNRNYNNLFDCMVDTFLTAIEALGYSNVSIVITETGWPSAGNDVATVKNAQAYNNNLIKHVLSNAGTPKRPGTSVETYIFAIFNENQKTGNATERHFGLFNPDETPAYHVDFSSYQSPGQPVMSPNTTLTPYGSPTMSPTVVSPNTTLTPYGSPTMSPTVVSPNTTLTPYGSPTMSPTMPPRSTNLSPLPGNSTHTTGKKTSKKIVILLGSVVGSTALFVMLCLVFGRCVRRWKTSVRTDKNTDARGNFGEVYFDYKILRDATGNFDRKNMLGKGGFGEVYKGRLRDGRDVAVKKLNGKHTTQAAEEFLTEVKLISSVRHRNLVCLLGCCKRGHKRLLVYEFMSNNSLDKHLFGEIRNPLCWENRLNIIVGTARGLAYLHGESNVRIIHRDIKCPNILLDDSFHPKIADFGLARFFPESQTHVSTRVGGTIGYTAPEYAVHGQLTEKADIYSYGIVVLEIVSGRKCVDARLPAPRQLLLEWAWNLFEQNQVLDIVDPLLEGQYQREEVLRVITVALLCTQGSWTQRPAMSQVVSMLTNNSQRIVEPTRPAFIDAAADRRPNSTSIPESETQAAAPTPTSHGSISISLLPR